MIRSFRLRLALLSALLSGLALAAFGLSAWWLIRDQRIERLDNDVRSHAEREVSRMRDPDGWQRALTNMAASLALPDVTALLVLAQDNAGITRYRSPGWPTGLAPAALPWPQPRGALRADAPPPARPGPERPPAGPPPATANAAQTVDGRHWRIGLAATPGARIAIAVDSAIVDREMAAVRNRFLVALPLTLILIGLGSGWFASRALQPLNRLTAAARRVTAEGLDQRIADRGEGREFGELIEVFNRMLERLERSFQQAHRFTADAAHELKTPLAILQAQLEHAIHGAEAGSALQKALAGILDEVRRLSTISRKLLLLSQADAGRLSLYRAPFDLSSALADLAEDARMLAPGLEVVAEVPPDIVISADDALLRQVLHNLISNAIKYNIENGWIRMGAKRSPGQVEIQVANASHGLPPDRHERIFERFYRADPAHGRKVEGVGLGLALSLEIVRAHGGKLSFEVLEDHSVRLTAALPG